jgi:hypothetical protein
MNFRLLKKTAGGVISRAGILSASFTGLAADSASIKVTHASG